MSADILDFNDDILFLIISKLLTNKSNLRLSNKHLYRMCNLSEHKLFISNSAERDCTLNNVIANCTNVRELYIVQQAQNPFSIQLPAIKYPYLSHLSTSGPLPSGFHHICNIWNFPNLTSLSISDMRIPSHGAHYSKVVFPAKLAHLQLTNIHGLFDTLHAALHSCSMFLKSLAIHSCFDQPFPMQCITDLKNLQSLVLGFPLADIDLPVVPSTLSALQVCANSLRIGARMERHEVEALHLSSLKLAVNVVHHNACFDAVVKTVRHIDMSTCSSCLDFEWLINAHNLQHLHVCNFLPMSLQGLDNIAATITRLHLTVPQLDLASVRCMAKTAFPQLISLEISLSRLLGSLLRTIDAPRLESIKLTCCERAHALSSIISSNFPRINTIELENIKGLGSLMLHGKYKCIRIISCANLQTVSCTEIPDEVDIDNCQFLSDVRISPNFVYSKENALVKIRDCPELRAFACT